MAVQFQYWYNLKILPLLVQEKVTLSKPVRQSCIWQYDIIYEFLTRYEMG